MNDVDVSLRLRIYRERAGLTQIEAAKVSGIGVKTLSSYETAARITSMKLTHLAMLCVAYRVELDEFLSPKNRIEAGEDPPPRMIEAPAPQDAPTSGRRMPVDPLAHVRTADDSRFPAPQSALRLAV